MKLSRQCRIAAVGPVLKDIVTDHPASFVQIEHGESASYDKPEFAGCIPADVLISSGSLIPLAVIDSIGAMDESLFIDAVDTEWCLRARSKGYQSFGVINAALYHSLGDKTYTVWFGRRRYLPEHIPLRFYYIFRNSLLLYKRGYIPLRWKVKNLITLVGLLLFSIALMPERFRRVKMVILGIYDGLCGKVGKCAAD
jgi:rhamnosyltransferase